MIYFEKKSQDALDSQRFKESNTRSFSQGIRSSARYAQIAQSVEQGIENPRVGGSIPPLGTILY